MTTVWKKARKDRYFCAKCGVQWDIRNDRNVVWRTGMVAGMITQGSNQYAGRCQKCEKLYCARCASFSGVTFQCPNCNSGLEAALHG